MRPRHLRRIKRPVRHFLQTTIPLLALMTAAYVVAIAVGATRLGESVASPAPTTPPPPSTTTTVPPAPVPYTGNAPGVAVVAPQTFDLPDPFLLTDFGQHYMFFSSAFGDTDAANVPELIDTAGQWTRWTDALPQAPSWALSRANGGSLWDPYVIRTQGRYVMYFSAELNAAHTDPSVITNRPIHCLGIAVSGTPLGPYVPVPRPPIVCQQSLGGDIDIQPVNDPQGPGGTAHPWYLMWKSDGNNLRVGPPSAIWSAGLSDDGLSLTGAPRVIFRADQGWQWPVVEAPQMVPAPDGSMWLFFSAGSGYFSPNYGIGVAACQGPLGPCSSVGHPALVLSNSQGEGPGEETVFVGSDHSYWLLYSPWHTGLPLLLFRPVEAVRIGWGPSGPYVANNTDTPLSAR